MDASCSQSYTVGSSDKPYGQDAHYPDKPTARSFTGPTAHATYTADYTTTDNVTGLIWKSCTEGQSGRDCSGGSAGTYTWYNAVNQCAALNTANGGAGYAGRTNWRLPTASELETLPNYGASNPAIDTAYFPATPAQYTWSSTTYIESPDLAWSVYFDGGYVDGYSGKTVNGYVRCVSSGLSGASSFSNGNGTVTDSATNLVWQQCSAGLSGTNCESGSAETKTWQNAMAYCEELNLAGKEDWRLPSANELKTIADRSTSAAPYIDASHFPSTASGYYWLSTTHLASPDNAWYVAFDSGNVSHYRSKTYSLYVRCVRSAP